VRVVKLIAEQMVKIKAFRATDQYDLCRRFIEGHRRVLDAVGVKQVTSSNDDWAYNPGAFVILVESDDETKVLGGARVHAVGGTQPLPLEEAAGYMDPKIYDMIRAYSVKGTGEICGLWNSIEVAGLGIGSVFLIRTAVAISTQIGLQTLFALCAPYTIKMAEAVGYSIETRVGNNGTFYYPKIDLLATAMILEDVKELSKANPEDREAINFLRENPTTVRIEKLRKKEILIDYQIGIANMDKFHLSGHLDEANK
jgi:hypothetical protein